MNWEQMPKKPLPSAQAPALQLLGNMQSLHPVVGTSQSYFSIESSQNSNLTHLFAILPSSHATPESGLVCDRRYKDKIWGCRDVKRSNEH